MSQPKALFLADVIKADPASKTHHYEAAAELRCLHALNGELLEALKLALSIIGFGKEHDAISAAIAKAEGEKT
jgi:hypothetical protein